jgi:hypothetical protein
MKRRTRPLSSPTPIQVTRSFLNRTDVFLETLFSDED